MYLLDQSPQKITHFRNNALYLIFIDPSENQCVFRQSFAKVVVHILEITRKEIVHIGYQSGEKKIIHFISYLKKIIKPALTLILSSADEER